MFRLKTTTPKNKIFFSPFVFTQEEGMRRIHKPLFKERTGTVTELVRVSRYPKEAVWNEELKDLHIDLFFLFLIKRIERGWATT